MAASTSSGSRKDIERVQAALDVARTQKGETLAQLRAELEGLQSEVQAQTRSDGDGSRGDFSCRADRTLEPNPG